MKSCISILFLAGILLFTTSCGKIFMLAFGVRNPKEYSEKDILREARKQNIPKEDVYVLDTSINNIVGNEDTAKEVRLMIKNHIQPAQALYYDKMGNLVSFHITCYAQGYRSKWNHFGAFNQFPPETAAPVDTLLPLNTHLSFIKTIDGNTLSNSGEYDYFVIVYFNRILRARGRRLVKEVKKNMKFIQDKKVRYIYVNTDGYWNQIMDADFSEF